MDRGTIIFLKTAIILIGTIVIGLCVFLLPWLANRTAEMYPVFAYLKYPVLIGVFVTCIPFFVALFQSFKLLSYIGNKKAFSTLSVGALRHVWYCAVMICIIYVIGGIFLLTQNALHPGIAIVGFTITFASAVIAVFTAVLQNLLKSALNIKLENDLTV